MTAFTIINANPHPIDLAAAEARAKQSGPLAWVEWNGYVNMCALGHQMKPNRKYIYDRAELERAIADMNKAQISIITTGTQTDAAIATGVADASIRAPRASVDLNAARAAFGVR